MESKSSPSPSSNANEKRQASKEETGSLAQKDPKGRGTNSFNSRSKELTQTDIVSEIDSAASTGTSETADHVLSKMSADNGQGGLRHRNSSQNSQKFEKKRTNGPTNSEEWSHEKPKPKAGYTCKICGKPGGEPDSHWFQLCPQASAEDRLMYQSGRKPQSGENRGDFDQTPRKFQAPKQGYVCKVCGKHGGEPDSHWFQQCPLRNSPYDATLHHQQVDPTGGSAVNIRQQQQHGLPNINMLQLNPYDFGAYAAAPHSPHQMVYHPGQIYYMMQQSGSPVGPNSPIHVAPPSPSMIHSHGHRVTAAGTPPASPPHYPYTAASPSGLVYGSAGYVFGYGAVPGDTSMFAENGKSEEKASDTS